MDRLMIALALGIACVGCAADVEDAQPEDTLATEPPANPPKHPFIAPYATDPIQFAVPVLDEYRLSNEPPARRAPFEVGPWPPE